MSPVRHFPLIFILLLSGCSLFFQDPTHLVNLNDPIQNIKFCDDFIDFSIERHKEKERIRYEEETDIFEKCSYAFRTANEAQKSFIKCIPPREISETLEWNKAYYKARCSYEQGKF